MTNNQASQNNWYFYESFTYDQKYVDRAVRALSSDVTKDELIEWITDEDEEIGFLAAANPILDLIDIKRLAEVIPRESFKITGLGCNPNAPDWLVEELLALRHASAIIRVNKESKWKLDSKTPVSVSPGVRLVVGQQEEYANLLSEARSRNTESSRLFEIYQMKLLDIQDRCGDDFGYEWYEDVNNDGGLFHSTQSDR